MKKDRNAFFNESSFSQTSANFPSNMPNYGMQPNYPMNGTFGQSAANQSFYSGPMPMNQGPMENPNSYMSDLESRLAKIERQINRLDARIIKLESQGFVTTENYDNTTNMYML